MRFDQGPDIRRNSCEIDPLPPVAGPPFFGHGVCRSTVGLGRHLQRSVKCWARYKDLKGARVPLDLEGKEGRDYLPADSVCVLGTSVSWGQNLEVLRC